MTYMCRLLLLLLSAEVCITIVYHVIPNESKSPATCTDCMKLHEYLQDIETYFTSNSQFYFRPGTHNIISDFFLTNISNLSLIGTNLAEKTIIRCREVGIKMMWMTNLKLMNLKISRCQITTSYIDYSSPHGSEVSLAIFNSYNVSLDQIILDDFDIGGRLLAVNLLGEVTFAGITGNQLMIYYTNSSASLTLVPLDMAMSFNHTLTIHHYTTNYLTFQSFKPMDDLNYNDPSDNRDNSYNDDYSDHSHYGDYRVYSYDDVDSDTNRNNFNVHYDTYTIPTIVIVLDQDSFGVTVKLVDTNFVFLEYGEIIAVTIDNLGIQRNQVVFENCTLGKNIQSTKFDNKVSSLITIQLTSCNGKSDKVQLPGNNIIKFSNCLFSQNYYGGTLIAAKWEYKYCPKNNSIGQLHVKEQIVFAHCSFKENDLISVLQLVSSVKDTIGVHFINTSFEKLNTSKKGYNDIIGSTSVIIYAINVTLFMEGPIYFNTINLTESLIFSNTES